MRKVDKYDLDGNYIESYRSIKIAAEKNYIGASSIRKALTGETETSAGYFWKYKEEKNGK